MLLPIVTPAPVVTAHAEAFRGLFDNQCAFRHFQNYLTGPYVEALRQAFLIAESKGLEVQIAF